MNSLRSDNIDMALNEKTSRLTASKMSAAGAPKGPSLEAAQLGQDQDGLIVIV